MPRNVTASTAASPAVLRAALSPETTPPIPLTNWNDYYVWPPVGGMRHLRFNCETNGFKSAFLKVGARILIDPDEFWRCVERANGKAAAKQNKELTAAGTDQNKRTKVYADELETTKAELAKAHAKLDAADKGLTVSPQKDKLLTEQAAQIEANRNAA